ncbi:hypothetical protein [Pseudonocardia zijingensis]|uniref:Uncharacterized protein n=1 Tax=Pseudonocardia zijingensis TaxID=153376 RepID=A0ABN1N8T5_9PSEU
MATTKQAADERPPFYDPAVHTDLDQWVYVELVCSCGRIWRQKDPVQLVEPQVRDWLARHAGEGHAPASIAAAVAEQERRRHAAFVVVGREQDYQPRERAYLDTSDTTARPWPAFDQPEA